MWLLGIDTGGTFTDFVLFDGKALKIHKSLSTPKHPERAILQGIKDLGVPANKLDIIHGSTVATNAVLENKGVRTAYITNYGLPDTLTIGRQARRELYNLQPTPTTPPVPTELCLETGGRLSATGEIVEPLNDDELIELRKKIEQLQPQAVAINLLFSFIDDHLEKRIEEALPDNIFISRSSFILPQYKEYERGVTTWLNASVGPLVKRYIEELSTNLPQTNLSIMQSSGGTIAAENAGTYAVRMLLSGPAGGLAGAAFIGKHCNQHRLLTFDMGGTSTDVSLIDGALKLTSETTINNYPVSIPSVDIHTIGAGGGSIAWIDDGGMLQVGPESAGASPGPACYGKGGTLPTVTDANLVLGRLRSNAFLGGNMQLDEEKAYQAVSTVAEQLDLSIEETASGIIQIANEHMAQALRVISIQRGLDPRDFTLVSFGGAGGLHVCALAERLGMTKAIAPIHAGVLSALGMLAAPRARHLTKTLSGPIDSFEETHIQNEFELLYQEGREALIEEGISPQDINIEKSIDVRYLGQSYTLTIPWQGLAQVNSDFNQHHETRYGHQLPLATELVNLRIAVSGPAPKTTLIVSNEGAKPNPQSHDTIQLYGLEQEATILHRDDLIMNQEYLGPLIITETTSTIFVAPQWKCKKDQYGNLLLNRDKP